ncbi:hypothetical protein [Bdellovibrio sp. HCB209]|uniref:hypothetical protein n=1 Tax=Bdellovibrio sp. HCB209 TaxID=3394354 RepID=UPI0039B591FB
MNKFVAMIALMVSSSAFAANYSADTSWEVLEKDPTIKIEAGTVFMGSSVDYTFVCVDGANLRTKKAVAQYDVVYLGQNQRKEIYKGSKYLTTPINYTRTAWECNWDVKGEHRNCEDKVISGSYPLTVTAKVSRSLHTKNGYEKFLFNKQLNVPNCESVKVN